MGLSGARRGAPLPRAPRWGALRCGALLLGALLLGALLLGASLLTAPGAAWARGCEALPLSDAVAERGALSYSERPPTPDLPESPVVIALHGLGHHKRGFSRLAAHLPASWRVVWVDAPWRYGGGFAWYRYRCPEGEGDMARATRLVLKLARQLVAQHPRAPRPALFGFSQGGAMTLSALSADPALWSAGAALSGYWLPSDPPAPAAPPAPALLVAHGERDEVVPFARGQEAARRFGEAGYAPRWLALTGGHRVEPRALQELAALFGEAWRPQRPAAPTAPPAPPPLSP